MACLGDESDIKSADRLTNIVDRDFNASKNILAEGLNVLAKQTTQGHWGSNACGDDKVHFSSVKKKKVVVCETGKVLTSSVG